MKYFTLFFVLTVFCAGCGQEVKMVETDPMRIDFTKKTQSDTIKAKALDMVGAEVPGISFTFESENPEIATVSPDGVVKPLANGSTAIITKSTEGVTGETFVNVCLPRELLCDPVDELKLKVGTAGPIKCHVTDCKGEIVPNAPISYDEADKEMVLKEETESSLTGSSTPCVGRIVGDTTVTVKSFEFEKTVKIHVDEQEYLPGFGPPKAGGGKKNEVSNDPYSSGGGRFDHILGNMKFN